jgi:hypothetical protein
MLDRFVTTEVLRPDFARDRPLHGAERIANRFIVHQVQAPAFGTVKQRHCGVPRSTFYVVDLRRSLQIRCTSDIF